MGRKIVKIFIMVIFLLSIYSINAKATYYVSDNMAVNSENTFSITITSSEPLENFDISLGGRGSLEYITCSSDSRAFINKEKGIISFAVIGANIKTLATYTFKAPKVTSTTTYTVTFNINGVSKTSNITVNPTEEPPKTSPDVPTTPSTKSSNANLSNLGIRPHDFTGFRAAITTYNVTVPYDIESVEVYATKQDSKASVTGTGKIRLKEGTNVAKVVVTAEDGTKKTYTINIVRQSETEEMVPNVIDETQEEKPEKLRLTAIVLQNDLNLQLSPQFDSEIFEYIIEVDEWLEKFEVTGIPNLNSAMIEVKGNEALTEENNIITITIKAEGYEDTVYTIKVIKKEEAVALNSEEEQKEPPTPDNLDSTYQRKRMIAIIAMGILIVIAIILTIILKVKKSRKRLSTSYYDYQHDYFSESNNKDETNQENVDNSLETEEPNQEENIETPQGYTAEIETDENYENRERKKRGKGKHF